MLIEITYNVTDVYMSTTETPVYVEISFEQPGGSAAVWGSITGTLSNQTDLQNALNAKFDDPTGTTAQYLRGDGSLATFPSLTGFVPYTGATGNVNLGEYELKAGQLTLDVSPTGTAAVGTTRWNDTIGSSETTLKGGSVILKNGVDLVARIVNKVTPNTTLTKAAYQAVRVSGAQGQRLAVAFAQANNDANSADTIGLVTETIATNQEGFIITVGQIENINTTGSLQGETWVDGDVLYLSPFTAGAITKVKPTGNGHIVVIGYVEYAHANNGKIYVKVMNGWELDELHDVSIVSPSNNEALIYESSTSLWKNKTISTALGYTPANAATTLTINGVTYDLSTSRSWTVAAGISGSGATGQVAYWTGTSSQSGSNNLFWDATNSRLGIGTNAPAALLDVYSSVNANSSLQVGSSQNTRVSINTQSGNRFGLLTISRIGDGTTPCVSIGVGTGPTSSSGVISANNDNLIFGYNVGNTFTETFRINTSNRLLLGSTTDSGERLQVQGTTLLNGNVTFSSATGMFWDAANSRLGIGTNAPANDLTISKTVDGVVRVGITNLSTGTNAFSGLAISNSVGAVALQLTGTGNTLVTPNQARLTTGSTITNGFTIETGTTAPITIGTSNTIGMTMFGSTRNVVLQNGGTFTDSGERLQVTGDTLLKGSGATVGTFGLKVQNSALTNLFRVRNDGAVFVEAVGSNAVLYMSSNGDSSIQKSTSGTNGMVLYGPTSSHHSLSISSFNSDNYSNGALSSLRFSGNFISASGSTAFSYMLLNGTINQTGTSTSIVRGLYVNPTLTAAADFRAIETARGNVVFGNLPTSSAGLPTGAIWNDAGTIKIV